MGFFGRKKGAANVTPFGGKSDVMEQMTRVGFGRQQRSTADRTKHLRKHGVEMPATLHSFIAGEPTPMFGGIPVDLELTVQPPGAAPYDVSVHQVFRDETVKNLTAGQQVTVRVDPNDPQAVMLWE
jgi:cold shock CspA family protein